MVPHLFVYGTLRRESGIPMARWLTRQGRRLGPGRLTGQLYDTGRYPVLLADPDGHAVHGELIRLHRPERALAELDIYEAAVPARGRPQLYRRALVAVEGPTGVGEVCAWTYLWTRGVEGLAALPHGDYFGGPAS